MQGGLGVRIGRDAGIIGVRFCFDKSLVFLVQGLGFYRGPNVIHPLCPACGVCSPQHPILKRPMWKQRPAPADSPLHVKKDHSTSKPTERHPYHPQGDFCDNISCMFHRSFCSANQEGLDIEDEDEKTLDENGLRGIRTVVLFEFCSRVSSMPSLVQTSAFYIKLIALEKVVGYCRSLLNVF